MLKRLQDNLYTNLAVAISLIIVMANIAANKLTTVFGVAVDCGFVFFPLTYLIVDIANEKFGQKQAEHLLWYGFFASFAMSFAIFIIKIMPEFHAWKNGEALDKFFALSFRISFASLSSYLVGLYLNTNIFTYLRTKYKAQGIIMRFFLSTLGGSFVENALFYLLAFSGLLSFEMLVMMAITQYFIKVVYNLIFSIIAVKIIFPRKV